MRKMIQTCVVAAVVFVPAALCAQPLPHWHQLNAASSIKKNVTAKVAQQEAADYNEILSHLSALGKVFYEKGNAFHQAIQEKTTAPKTGDVSAEVMAQVVLLSQDYHAYIKAQNELFVQWDNEVKTHHPSVVGAHAREMWSSNLSEIKRQKTVANNKKANALKERNALLQFANKKVGSFRLMDTTAYLTKSGLSQQEQARVQTFLKDVKNAARASLK